MDYLLSEDRLDYFSDPISKSHKNNFYYLMKEMYWFLKVHEFEEKDTHSQVESEELSEDSGVEEDSYISMDGDDTLLLDDDSEFFLFEDESAIDSLRSNSWVTSLRQYSSHETKPFFLEMAPMSAALPNEAMQFKLIGSKKLQEQTANPLEFQTLKLDSDDIIKISSTENVAVYKWLDPTLKSKSGVYKNWEYHLPNYNKDYPRTIKYSTSIASTSKTTLIVPKPPKDKNLYKYYGDLGAFMKHPDHKIVDDFWAQVAATALDYMKARPNYVLWISTSEEDSWLCVRLDFRPDHFKTQEFRLNLDDHFKK